VCWLPLFGVLKLVVAPCFLVLVCFALQVSDGPAAKISHGASVGSGGVTGCSVGIVFHVFSRFFA
jgi:hypothetical protein